MNLLSRLVQSWVAWVLPRPRLVLGMALVTAAASLFLAATKLHVQTDQLELISAKHPLIALSRKLEPFNFDGRATFSVVIKAPTPRQAVAFISELGARVGKDTAHFRDVFYRVDPDLFKKWALLYLDRKDLLQIRESLEEHSKMIAELSAAPDLLGFLKLVNREMASRMVGELFTGFLDEDSAAKRSKGKEPMDLGFLIQTLNGLSSYLDGHDKYTSPWSSFFKSRAWDLDQEGYFWEANKRFAVLIAIPAKLAMDAFSDTQISLGVLRRHIRDVKALHPDVEAGVTGQEALNNDEMRTVLGDMSVATWFSLLGVFVLLILFLRSLRRSFIEVATLIVGLCWTFGWTTIFIGHLNILSVVFAPLLCGLGVDYGIHWMARFEEEERDGALDNRALTERVMDRSGPGIVLAGVSAAFSFIPFVLTGFAGLMELGLITGMGILLILLAGFTVLPALMILFGGCRKRAEVDPGIQAKRDLIRLGRGSASLVLAAAIGLCVLSVLGLRGVRFELNPLLLQAANAESVVWEKALIEQSEHQLLSAAAFASSPEETSAKAKRFEALPTVASVKTVFGILPEDQEEKLPLLRALLPLIPEMRPSRAQPDPAYISDVIETLERIRFKLQDDQAEKWGADKPLVEQMATVRNLGAGIIGALRASPEGSQRLAGYRARFTDDLNETWSFLRDGAAARPMTLDDTPKMLRDQFLRDGLYLLRVFPRESIWEEEALARFVKDVMSVEKDVVGDPVSLHLFASAYKRACMLASAYALAAIFLLLILTFRNLRHAALALIPLVVGTVWTAGIMGVAGVDFNLANSMFMPLVVGAGVEYAIIIIARWREGGMRPGHLPWSTGKGVILAALTTTVGFGTLMISRHQGIFSLGFVAWSGSLCVLATAIFVLPAILAGMNPPEGIPLKKEKDNGTMVSNCLDVPVLTRECSSCVGANRKRR